MSKNIKQGKRRYQIDLSSKVTSSSDRNKKQATKECPIKKNQSWTIEEDELLTNLVKKQKNRKWAEISKHLGGRTQVQCRLRWNKLKLGLKRGQWTAHEDKLLNEWIKKVGPKKWEQCGHFIHGRSGKQCREHWNNCLNPDLIKGEWTAEEDFLIMQFYEENNGSWKNIIYLFDGRTENSIKNRFFSQLRKIAGRNLSISERKGCSKIKLEELKIYLKEAISEAKTEFLSEKQMSEEELNNYLNEKKKLILKRNLSEENNYYNYYETNKKNTFAPSENTEKNEENENTLLKKRNRSEKENIEQKNCSENENKENIFRIKYDDDIDELKNKCICLDENIENENNLFNISDNSTDDNKDESIKINDIIIINNDINDINNGDGDDNFISFIDAPMNNYNNFIENLDYHYQPSYTFLENCDFFRNDFSNENNMKSINNCFDEKNYFFGNENNNSLSEDL